MSLIVINMFFVSQVNVFLARVQGDPIGVSAFGLFVVDKASLLTVIINLIFALRFFS